MEKDRLEHAVLHSKKLKRKREYKPGFVYIVACHDLIKVGVSDDPKQRLIQLQVGCPYELRLITSFRSTRAASDEARLHALWKPFEMRGEWFRVPAGELAYAVNATSFEDIFTTK